MTGEIIDTQGYQSCMFAIAIGTLADANATFTILLQEGDESDLSDASSVADADMHGTETTAAFQFDDDDEVRVLGYRGNSRYVRLTITPAGNTGNADVSAVALLGDPLAGPVSQTTA
jgi:hypothetical protein